MEHWENRKYHRSCEFECLMPQHRREKWFHWLPCTPLAMFIAMLVFLNENRRFRWLDCRGGLDFSLWFVAIFAWRQSLSAKQAVGVFPRFWRVASRSWGNVNILELFRILLKMFGFLCFPNVVFYSRIMALSFYATKRFSLVVLLSFKSTVLLTVWLISQWYSVLVRTQPMLWDEDIYFS